jgi:hypothetical protein
MEQLPSQKNRDLQALKGGFLAAGCWPRNTAWQGLLAMQQRPAGHRWLKQ